MHVTLILHTKYEGRACGAVWIVESPQNWLWFTAQKDLDPNSAVFTVEWIGNEPQHLREIIWEIDVHYADWTSIGTLGATLTESLRDELADEGGVSLENGQILLKRI